MAHAGKNKQKNAEPAYLTKRILVRAAKAGIHHAVKETKQIMGYTVIAEGGWVIKRYNNGSEEKLSKIALEKRPAHIVLK